MSLRSNCSIPSLLATICIGLACRPSHPPERADPEGDQVCDAILQVFRACYDNRPDIGPNATDAEKEHVCTALGTIFSSNLPSEAPPELVEAVSSACATGCQMGLEGMSWSTVKSINDDVCESM